MKGRWAAGIVPRNFAWIVKDRLAVSERLGGYAPHHRPVRRQEEILWLSAQGFTRVVSLLPSSHNLHAYEELHLPASHFPLPAQEDVRDALAALYPALLSWLRKGERLLVHQEELGERVAGVMAGFLYWTGVLAEPPQAISAIEQLLRRQLGSVGRSIVTQAVELPLPLDEHGVPLPRRSIVVESTLLGMPDAFAKLSERDQHPSANDGDRSSAASDAIASDAIEKRASASRSARKGTKAPKPSTKVAAIRPITNTTKVASAPLTGAKPGASEPAKKRSTAAAKKKDDRDDVVSKGRH